MKRDVNVAQGEEVPEVSPEVKAFMEKDDGKWAPKAFTEGVNAPEIADVPSRETLTKRYRTIPIAVYVPPWQDEFLTEAGRIFGRPKSEFIRAAIMIVINRIVEKYSESRPEIAKLAEIVPH